MNISPSCLKGRLVPALVFSLGCQPGRLYIPFLAHLLCKPLRSFYFITQPFPCVLNPTSALTKDLCKFQFSSFTRINNIKSVLPSKTVFPSNYLSLLFLSEPSFKKVIFLFVYVYMYVHACAFLCVHAKCVQEPIKKPENDIIFVVTVVVLVETQT